jgi:hypothetical protein
VVVQPVAIARNVPGVQPGTFQDRITANIFVLDGGPLEFGGKPEKYVPHTLVVATPYLAEGIYISQSNLLTALNKALPSPQKPSGGLVVGVIVQGKASKAEHNPPWNLLTLDEGDPRKALASQLLQRFFTGQFVNPEPQETGTPTPAAGALAYTHATTMPHTPNGQPIPNLQEFSTPVAAAPAPAPNGAPSYADLQAQMAALQAQMAGQAAAPAGTLPGGFHSGQPAAPVTDVPPAGWQPEIWATLSPEQKAGIRASMAPAPAASAYAASPGGMPPF